VYNAASRTLHAIRGVPGSAYTGPAIADNLDKAWPAPAGAIAVAVRADKTILLTALDGDEPAADSRLGLLSNPSLAKWSPSGKFAVLFAEGQLQVVRVAGGQISAGTPVEVAFLGNIAGLAVNDTGDVAAASAAGVYLAGSSGATLLNDAADIIELRFGPRDILYAAASDRLLRVDMASRTADVLIKESGISTFAVSHKTGRVYAAGSDDRVIHVYDGSGAKTGTIPLDRAPATLDALIHDSLLLLNPPDADGKPVMALQLSEEPSVVFIPADSSTL
jgi:hypothetical protein